VLTEWPTGTSASPSNVLADRQQAQQEVPARPVVDAVAEDSELEEAANDDADALATGRPAEQAEPVAEPEPEPVQEQPAPVIAEGQLHMLVTYSGDCWTEISDASGRRLFFALGQDGRTVELSGEAPFNVLFGDADNVSLRVNGEAFEIPPAARRGRTARLTIAGN
jgi:cytoskeleton protein RodZ